MKKRIVLLFAFLLSLCATQSMFAWGRVYHDSIAYIAECHLTPKAKAAIEKNLGHSIVYYASWMDQYRHTPKYKYTTTWHSGGVDKDLFSTPEARKKNGDCVTAVENSIAALKDRKKLSDEDVSFNLKVLIHLIGDMHCPVHISYPGIKMKFNVTLFSQKMTYHKLWDSGMLESAHAWSYMEYQHQLDRYSEKERNAISKGTPAEWFHESAVDCRVIYDWAAPDAKLDRDFVNQAHGLAEAQIVKAGYRLARTLNELFE